jgi:cardiolipin synthase
VDRRRESGSEAARQQSPRGATGAAAGEEAFIVTLDFPTVFSLVVTVLVAIAVVAVLIALATDDRDPSVVLAWLFVMLLVPALGVIAYYLIGRNYRRAGHSHERRAALDTAGTNLDPVVTANASFSEDAVAALAGTSGQRVEGAGRREGGTVPLPADTVSLYFTGADKFRNLLADLRSARRYVDLMYLIWEQDTLTAEVTAVLLDRLQAGVEVRILYDWLTCLPYKKEELKRLASAGAVVVPCYKGVRRLNYRNHMKMAIIDGEIVYSGGMNMGQEYIDGGPRFDVWRDTHFRITGPVVAPYLSLFAATWSVNGRKEDVFTGYVAAPEPHLPGTGTAVQVLHSSVSTQFPTIRDVFVVALLNARRRVWVQSPYFVPDEPLLTALCVAASSGVDVRFMMTGMPDKKVPFYAAQGYLQKALEAGVRVYQFKAGFLHAKTVTVDDELAIVGTCNWDIRSIILHDEVVSGFYDEQVAKECAVQYELDIRDCAELTVATLSGLSPAKRLRNSACRLMSRLL